MPRNDTTEPAKNLCVKELFDEMFLTALEIGMTYKQFWLDNPELYYFYLTAYNKKELKRLKDSDYNNWSVASYIANAVWADKKSPYLKEPRLTHYGETPKSVPQQQAEYEQERKHRMKEMCRRLE